MRKKLSIIIFTLLLFVATVNITAFANESINDENEQVVISEDVVVDLINEEDNTDKNDAVLTCDRLNTKVVTESGDFGHTSWEIFTNGDAVIFPKDQTDGKMPANTPLPYQLTQVTGEIIVEAGVVFPDNSKGLFEYLEATSMVFRNEVSNVTSMEEMFLNSSSIISIDASSWSDSKVTNMMNMFWAASSLTTLDIGN